MAVSERDARIVQFNPNDVGGYMGQGEYLERIGQVKDAIEFYRASLTLAPQAERVNVLETLGSLLGRSGQPAESLQHFQEAVRLLVGAPGKLYSYFSRIWSAAGFTGRIASFSPSELQRESIFPLVFMNDHCHCGQASAVAN